ncbi:unnamed protein product [Cyclocybe aegerita]|uniref:J domain-containing protein n=1 Tax=Cyclocybe aegerita TaxID=1973307 RepID=A0A8S0VSF5_CYCAE|nr:unnamed protein product [Cyclocybe aegerita]
MSVHEAYRVLGVPEGSSPDTIRNAYRILALKWHPDRHHNIYDRDTAARHFMEVTNAYRTLVRHGYPKAQHLPRLNTRPNHPSIRQIPLMPPQSSSKSSVSLDSFIHLVASSTESLTTSPSSSNRDSPRSSWKQGVRQPADTMASQYRNPAVRPAHTFTYDGPRRGGDGPAIYKAPPRFAPPAPQKEAKSSTKTSRPNISTPYCTRPAPPPSRYPPQPLQFRDHPKPRTQLPPYGIPLASIGLGRSSEWIYSLSLTLEELFTGKHCRFGITRSYISNKTKNVVIEIDVPAGCRPGTRILCRNVGHEWKPGVFQDIAFIIEEAPHDRFVRLFDDLIMDVRLPWVDSLRRQGGKVPFMGIDGRSLLIQIDYPEDKNMKGRSVIKGAGMPIRERGRVAGRGNLIVQWEILPPKAKILHFMKRLWGGK